MEFILGTVTAWAVLIAMVLGFHFGRNNK